MFYLDQFGVLMWQLTVGKFVSLDDPWMFEDLFGRQSLMWIHMEHL